MRRTSGTGSVQYIVALGPANQICKCVKNNSFPSIDDNINHLTAADLVAWNVLFTR